MKIGKNLTEGPILKKFLMYMIPIILSNFMQQLYNSADSVVVGRFAGANALAAVGATTSLTYLMVNFFVGLSVGTNVVCAKCYGADDKEGLSRALHTSVVLGFIIGIPLIFFGRFTSKSFLGLMGTPADVIDKAALYMKIYFLGAPASLIYNYGAAALRAVGDTKRPLYILAFTGILNVALNLLCVIVFRMDVAGVAIGTIAAQYASAVAIIVIFLKTDSELKLSLTKLKIYSADLKKILAVGLPAGLNGTMFEISNVLIQSSINAFGVSVIAANSVGSNYTHFAYILVSAGDQATTSFVGQNMGAKKFDRIKQIIKTAIFVTTAITLIFSLIIVLNGKMFLGFFTHEPAVIDYGLIYLSIFITPYFLFAPGTVIGGALRGMGYAVTQTVLSLVFVCALRVVLVLLVSAFCPSYNLVLASYPVSWIALSIASLIAYSIVSKKELR